MGVKQRRPTAAHFNARLLARQCDDIVFSIALKLFAVDAIPPSSRQTTDVTNASKLAVTCRDTIWIIAEPLSPSFPLIPITFPDNDQDFFFSVTTSSGSPNSIILNGLGIDITNLFVVDPLDVVTIEGTMLNIETPFGVGGVVSNDGSIRIENSGIFRSSILLGLLTLSGSGRVVLDDSQASLGILGLNSVVNRSSHTVEGHGKVIGALLDNSGLIHANHAGDELRVSALSVDSGGTMRASSGGQLTASPSSLDNSGTIEALASSSVKLDAVSLDGGGLTAARDGGFVRIVASDVTNSTLRAEGTGVLLIDDTHVNNSGSLIEAHDTASVDILNNVNRQINGGTFRTTGSGVIRGVGGLNIITGNVTNEGLLQSMAGVMRFEGTALQNPTGNIQALAGAPIHMRNNVTLSGDGVIDIFDNTAFDPTPAMTWQDVTINVRGAAALTLLGDITNNATLQINDLIGDKPSPSADVIVGTNLTLDGTGRVRFASSDANLIVPANPGDATTPGDMLTIGQNQTVTTSSGASGEIRTLTVNNGIIDADAGTITLNIQLNNQTALPDFTNNNLLGASNAGRLVTPQIIIDNAGGAALGTIFATPGSRVDMADTTVIGGIFDGGGLVSLERTVTFDTIGSVGPAVGMTINPDTTIAIGRGNNARLDLNGTLTNNGVIRINDTNSSLLADAELQINADVTIDGTGQVTFNTNLSNALIPLNPTDVLTIGPNQTITTTANAQGNITTLTINNGIIDANNQSATTGTDAVIRLLADSTNNGLIEASNGGRMIISDITIDNASGAALGTISIDPTSQIDITRSTITGSTINGGGRMDVDGIVVFDGVGLTIDDPTTTINVGVGNGVALDLIGNITNNALIRLNDLNTSLLADARLRINGNVTLGGSGQVVFNSDLSNEITPLDPNNPVDVLTIGPNQTIKTAGPNSQGFISVMVDNTGTINADAGLIRIDNSSMTNTGLLQATNAGTLRIDNLTVTNTAGTILSGTNSLVEYNTALVTGGRVAGQAASSMTLNGSTIENAAFGGGSISVIGRSRLRNATPVTEPTIFTVGVASTLTLEDTTLQNAAIFLNDTDPEFTLGNDATLEIDGNTLLAGNGQVFFRSPHQNNIDSVSPTDVLTLDTGMTLATNGTGSDGDINVNLVNNGTIDANDGQIRFQSDSKILTNNDLVRVRNNGSFLISNGSVVENANGTITVDPSSALTISGSGGTSTVRGGTIDGGGAVDLVSTVTFDGIGMTRSPILLQAPRELIPRKCHSGGARQKEGITLGRAEPSSWPDWDHRL